MTYEQRLERDVDRILERITAISGNVEEALKGAVHALLTADRTLAYDTILGDARINLDCRELIKAAHHFIARHLPSAGHLRFISSVMRLGDELERIGDYAVTICRETAQFREKPPISIQRDIDLLADQTFSMFKLAVRSFIDGNAEKARGIQTLGDQIGRTFDRVFQDLVAEGDSGSRHTEDLFAMLIICNRLSRVASRSKNICEGTIFYVTGETKEPKRYRVLFLDARNQRASILAEAIGRKAFSEQGEYESCGWSPAKQIDSGFLQLLDEYGLRAFDREPRPVPPYEELSDYDVIVSLEPGIEKHVAKMPFYGVLREWELRNIAAEEKEDLTRLHQELTGKIEHLMETLWGQSE